MDLILKSVISFLEKFNSFRLDKWSIDKKDDDFDMIVSTQYSITFTLWSKKQDIVIDGEG